MYLRQMLSATPSTHDKLQAQKTVASPIRKKKDSPGGFYSISWSSEHEPFPN